MKKINIFDIEGTEFPAGRRTRVMIGENGAINGEHFCQGYVVIYKDGYIPMHEHISVETYTIIKGEGEMTVDNETVKVIAGDCVYIDKNKHHELRNTAEEELHMMFVYAPKMVADHWKQEMSGELK
jgi:mannose-6-phosphate isomerase-like protein (cupin superfamily)